MYTRLVCCCSRSPDSSTTGVLKRFTKSHHGMDGWLRALTSAIVLGVLSACSDDSAEMAEEPPQVIDEIPAADSESSYEIPSEQDEAEPREVAASPSFMGYDCTDDCSGHEAGYQWAEENGIDDPSDCGGNSNSFIEGCEAYAEEQ